jgi:hypothetical protein
MICGATLLQKNTKKKAILISCSLERELNNFEAKKL